MTKQFLTVGQVCDRWQVCRQWVTTRIADRTLKAVNVGGDSSGSRWRIALDSVERFERDRANVEQPKTPPVSTAKRRRPPPATTAARIATNSLIRCREVQPDGARIDRAQNNHTDTEGTRLQAG